MNEPSTLNETTAEIVAYELFDQSAIDVKPAPIPRTWMEKTANRFAYRCLPMTIANQSGWFVTNGGSLSARWNGGNSLDDTKLVFDESPPRDDVRSFFGNGIITFNLPFLFRTPPEMNLWVKGPSNSPKDGVYPLEGIVEADWATSTFTMNWKITRPNHIVRFERGEPICMIVPVARGTVEQFIPVRRPISDDSQLMEAYNEWSRSRSKFNEQIQAGDAGVLKEGWQKDYFQGRVSAAAEPLAQHQTRLRVKEFNRCPDGHSPATESD